MFGLTAPNSSDILHRTPQGARSVLYAGDDPAFVGAYRAYSPSSQIVEIAGSDLLARLDTEHAGARFDALSLDGIAERSDDPVTLFERLRDHAGIGAVLTLAVLDPAGVQSEPVAATDIATVEAALKAAGWTQIDRQPLTTEGDAAEAETEGSGPITRAWLIRAVNGPAQPPITIAALGLRKMAGVTDARIDHPMAALASRPFVRAAWSAGGVQIPNDWSPGVLILHRQFLDNPAFVSAIEARIARGWTIVSEIDDDPHHWPQYPAANFRAFRGVHAVTVSTEPLAEIIRQWNPNVHVLPNAAPYLPPLSYASPKGNAKVRVFFGALNRGGDWAEIVKAIARAARNLAKRVEFVVVHDRAFFDALPTQVDRKFVGTQPYDRYLELLASSDIALLPLNDTPFNRLKSDIKFVECCAAGVVPICSPTLYAEDHQDRGIALFAQTPQDWAEALTTLIRDRDDRDRRRDLALTYAREHRMHADMAAGREQLFRSLLQDRPRLEAERQARIAAHLKD